MEKKSWDSISSERLNENVTRKMFWGENIMVTRVELVPGSSVPVHDHVAEQVTMVERGSLVLTFPDGADVELRAGEILVIPSSVPHGVQVGPEATIAVDLFSPIRKDFIEGSTSYYSQGSATPAEGKDPSGVEGQDKDPYVLLSGYLASVGIRVPLERLREVPVEVLSRYCYERQSITMGQLRAVLGLDKTQAKDLLRQWKHGDDHSEASLQRKLERMIVFPEEIKKWRTT